ncbi:MAG: hypothetical protein ACYC6N_29490 [Pirellulaceae bacterium]
MSRSFVVGIVVLTVWFIGGWVLAQQDAEKMSANEEKQSLIAELTTVIRGSPGTMQRVREQGASGTRGNPTEEARRRQPEVLGRILSTTAVSAERSPVVGLPGYIVLWEVDLDEDMRWRYAIGESLVSIRAKRGWATAGVRFWPPEDERQNAPGKKRAGCVRGVGFAPHHESEGYLLYWAIVLYDKQTDEVAVLDVFPLPLTPQQQEAIQKEDQAS